MWHASLADVSGSASASRAQIPARADATIAELATAQQGVISRAQLLAAGMSAAAIGRRVAGGRLLRLHPGIYAVGHRALRPEGILLAAAMAGGPGAVLSHRSAAAEWGLRPSAAARVDITVPGDRGRSSPALSVHQGRLAPEDVTRHDGIPITTPARTLLDLAEVVSREQLDRAVDRALELRLYDQRALDAVIARSPGRRGLRPLRATLAALDPGRAATRSELERRMLALLDAHGLECPQVNARLGPYEVDLLWSRRRLVAELDGRAFHSSPRAFEADRRRDAELQAAGYRVVRLTWRQVTREPRWVAARLARLLAAPP
jgi:very-short-patch-repair endonuclease